MSATLGFVLHRVLATLVRPNRLAYALHSAMDGKYIAHRCCSENFVFSIKPTEGIIIMLLVRSGWWQVSGWNGVSKWNWVGQTLTSLTYCQLRGLLPGRLGHQYSGLGIEIRSLTVIRPSSPKAKNGVVVDSSSTRLRYDPKWTPRKWCSYPNRAFGCHWASRMFRSSYPALVISISSFRYRRLPSSMLLYSS